MDVIRAADGEIAFRLPLAPIPAQEFEAEVAWAALRYGAVSFFFGKTQPMDDHLRMVAEIRFGYEAFNALWETIAGAFRDAVNSWASSNSQVDGGRPKPGNLASPEHLSYAWFRATIAVISHAGSDAGLDFYALPVGAVSSAMRDASVTRVPLVPLIRVTCGAHELARFLTDCERIHNELSKLADVQQPKLQSGGV